MGTQESYPAWEDGIDLRALVNIVRRRKWVLLLFVAAAIAIGGVLTYVTLPPRYESSAVIALPIAGSEEMAAMFSYLGAGGTMETRMDFLLATGGGSNRQGLTLQGYREFAASYPVRSEVARNLGSGLDADQLADRYRFRLEPEARLLTVTTWATTREDAFAQAVQWIEVFDRRVQSTIQRQVDGLKAAASHRVEAITPQLTRVREALDAFDQETPLGFMEARLSSIESDLINSERRLRDLTSTVMPVDEARLAFLREALNEEPRVLSGGVGTVVASKVTSTGDPPTEDVTVLNPVYIQLAQEIVASRARLASSQKEAETLAAQISGLQREIEELRGEILTLRASREQLDREVKRLETIHEPARIHLDTILEMARRLPEFSGVEVISGASFPAKPEPRPGVRNLALAAALGAVAGLIASFFLEFYQGAPPAGGRQQGHGPSTAGPN